MLSMAAWSSKVVDLMQSCSYKPRPVPLYTVAQVCFTEKISLRLLWEGPNAQTRLLLQMTPSARGEDRWRWPDASPHPNGQTWHRTDQLTSPPSRPHASGTHDSPRTPTVVTTSAGAAFLSSAHRSRRRLFLPRPRPQFSLSLSPRLSSSLTRSTLSLLSRKTGRRKWVWRPRYLIASSSFVFLWVWKLRNDCAEIYRGNQNQTANDPRSQLAPKSKRTSNSL